jgi:hypothetical protein
VFGRVVGERGDPVGAGAVQGGVDLGEGRVELLALGGDVGDVLSAPLLVLGKGAETLPKLAFGRECLLYLTFRGGDLGPGVADGLMVVAAPPAPAGVLE